MGKSWKKKERKNTARSAERVVMMADFTDPLVSVIVPAYRTEPYLNRCVASVAAQTYARLEIILVDDGSPDACGQMCDEWSGKDPRIQVIHKTNGGLSDARNAGLNQAKGEYITFVDSDDWVEPDLIAYLMQGIRQKQAQVAVCNFYTVRGEKKIPWRKPEDKVCAVSSVDAVTDMLYGRSFDTSAWAKLFHQSCFDSIRFPTGRLYEEVATTYRLLLTQNVVAVGMRPLYNYVKRASSIVTSQFQPRSMDMLAASREILAFAKEQQSALVPAAERRMVYACCYLYKTMGPDWRDYPREVAELNTVMKQYRSRVLKDPGASLRDKTAILLLALGIGPFEAAWGLYSRWTGRERFEA